jgi:hypothetical protein
MTPHDDIPSDCEPDVREAFAAMVEARARFYDAKIVDIDVMRRRRDLAAAGGRNWSPNTKGGA